MDNNPLLHLHPTLPVLASALVHLGISCRQEGRISDGRFRGVSLYTDTEPEEDLLYVLRPEDGLQFPTDRFAYICTQPIGGSAGHLFCPDREPIWLLSVLMELFARWQSWELQLDRLVYRNAPLHELCQLGEDILGNPICIHDDWFIMIAMSRELPKVMPPDYIMSSSKEFVPQVIVDDFKYDADYLETYAYQNAQLWRSTPDAANCLYVNLRDGDVYRGRLLVVEYHRSFHLLDYTAAEVLTQRVGFLLQRQHLGQERSYHTMDDVMFSLLKGEKLDTTGETQLMRMLNWNKSDWLVCILIQSQQSDSSQVMGHVLHSDLFQAFPESYIMFEGQQQCVILNLARQRATVSGIRHTLAPLCRDYCQYAGISSPVCGTGELHLAYHQAQTALAQAFRLKTSQWIIPFSDCALDYIYSHLQTPLQASHIVSPELQYLMEYDKEKGTQYFDTLRAYLRHERDIPRTSEALIIHRTTLLYRLKKIQALTELDLNSPEQRLYLNLSLWILEQEKIQGN